MIRNTKTPAAAAAAAGSGTGAETVAFVLNFC